MDEIAPWEVWVRQTWLHHFVLEHYWLWPTLESLHFLGLSLLLATVGMFDLRVLGVAKGIPPGTLHRLIPYGVAGYLFNVTSGISFFFAYPEQYAYNNAFRFKLSFMLFAGLNMLLFYSAAFREVRSMPAGRDAPLRAKIFTGISLASWSAVLVCGRLLTFFRPPYFHTDV